MHVDKSMIDFDIFATEAHVVFDVYVTGTVHRVSCSTVSLKLMNICIL